MSVVIEWVLDRSGTSGRCSDLVVVSIPDEIVDALTAGDWAPFVELAAGLADEETCKRWVAENDPAAWGAAFRARGQIEWGRFDVPVVGYLGDEEQMREQACGDAQRLGFPMAALPQVDT